MGAKVPSPIQGLDFAAFVDAKGVGGIATVEAEAPRALSLGRADLHESQKYDQQYEELL
jgi:hypothetical protein